MSWQDWGDIRKARGSTPTGAKRSKDQGWKEGGARAIDAKIAARNHRKAMEEQRKAEAEAQRVADVKARKAKLKWEEKEAKQARKRAEKDARKGL